MINKHIFVSVIFSFRNEESNIEELVRRTALAINSLSADYELIFINDCSNDNSLAVLLNLQQNYPIIILNTSRRFGVTPCVLAGLEYSKGDIVIYLDADLQDPPELIPDLVYQYHQGYDVVHTTRTHRKGESKLKLIITNMAYKFINLLSEIDLPINTGDFKLLSRKVVNEILKLKEYDPYMRGLSVWVGYNQGFVKYERDERYAGTAKFSLLSSGPVKEFLRGLTSYSAFPLYISFILGLIVIFISILLIIWTLVVKFLGLTTPGSASILIAISFFSGIILITNGLMGLYLSKMFYDLKGRPRYIIKEVLKK